jgi:hypothetical protein
LIGANQDKVTVKEEDSSVAPRLNKKELAPISIFLNPRNDSLIILNNEDADKMLIPTETKVVESSYDEKILGFEVFNHYMAVLEEKNF